MSSTSSTKKDPAVLYEALSFICLYYEKHYANPNLFVQYRKARRAVIQYDGGTIPSELNERNNDD
jgi:hypothetical protein